MEKLNELQKRLGYTFADTGLLKMALTHATYANEHGVEDNERLEFLGDAVLGATVARLLYLQYPNEKEGVLSLYRQHLVCEETLSRLARRLGVGECLLLGNGESNRGGRERKSILADAMEAIIAAVSLDTDALGTRRVIAALFAEEIAHCPSQAGDDYKTRLKNLVERGGNELLEYRLIREEGPRHAPTYTVGAYLNSNLLGRGVGHSKQEAEQAAAHEALTLFIGTHA